MSSTVPPAAGVAPAAPLRDVAHPPAAAAVPPAHPDIPIRDVTHTPTEPAQAHGPVTDSEPLPVPMPSGTSHSQLTAKPQREIQKPSMVGGIAPVAPLYRPEPQKRVAQTPAAPAPAAAPVAAVEVHEASPIAGGTVAAPVVPLPQDTPTAAVGTPFAVADSVRQLAGRNGIDLGAITPTGRGGRITKKDVESAIAAAAITADTAAEPTESPERDDGAENGDSPLPAAVHTPPRKTGSAPAGAAPAEPTAAPTADPDPVAYPAPAQVAEAAQLNVHLDFSAGHTIQIGSSDDLLALARTKLPLFHIRTAVLDLSATGAVLLATVDSSLEVTL